MSLHILDNITLGLVFHYERRVKNFINKTRSLLWVWENVVSPMFSLCSIYSTEHYFILETMISSVLPNRMGYALKQRWSVLFIVFASKIETWNGLAYNSDPLCNLNWSLLPWSNELCKLIMSQGSKSIEFPSVFFFHSLYLTQFVPFQNKSRHLVTPLYPIFVLWCFFCQRYLLKL